MRDSRAPAFRVTSLEFFERDVRLRMPFRFGVVTMTEAPQAFVRCRIRTEAGRDAEGAAAELLAPKWFDKNPALSNEDNFDQLRQSLRAAASDRSGFSPRPVLLGVGAMGRAPDRRVDSRAARSRRPQAHRGLRRGSAASSRRRCRAPGGVASRGADS